MTLVRLVLCTVTVTVLVGARARPDSAGHVTTPPGLAYGGIPYGSMSGNVAEYFRRTAPSLSNTVNIASNEIAFNPDFSPIEQYL
ncbi:hypothetical protein EVAR_37460_1 [Eumeta japonica]|uniref:Uncharacterized protein n=1 Tax=Eumeta variegata TaxID=151549 RepID=A0A4C1XBH8_EUMVA|nr:hypothetical protein EVAR_37460_1 [Eumeta japonica]